MIHDTNAHVSHTELALGEDRGLSTISHDLLRQKASLALANVARLSIEQQDHRLVAIRKIDDLLAVFYADQNRRRAFQIRTREQLGVPRGERLVDIEGGSFAVQSLIALHERCDNSTLGDAIPVDDVQGKRITMELAHIDQLGDWEAARKLDQEIRDAVPWSQRLRQAGFTIDHIYDVEDAKKRYRFYNRATRLGESCLNAIRTRAVADIVNGNHRYEIVKSSSFLIDDDVVPVKKMRRAQQKGRRDVADKLGMKYVEPYIADRQKRKKSLDVLPVSSLYFALYRE